MICGEGMAWKEDFPSWEGDVRGFLIAIEMIAAS